MELSKTKIREIVAKRVAKEFFDGEVVTLGIGLPTEAANYVPENINVIFQSENGLLGAGKTPDENNIDTRVTNAGGACVQTIKGACFYDSQMAFILMRGGHIDATVLGALQVDEEGSIASWLIPGKFTPGIGGAMDLIIGAKKVIIAMEHTSKGQSKIVKKCDLPLTAYKEANLIITERCVLEVTNDGLLMKEINPEFTVDEILTSSSANITVSPDLKNMEV